MLPLLIDSIRYKENRPFPPIEIPVPKPALEVNTFYRLVVTIENKARLEVQFKIYANKEEIVNHVVTSNFYNDGATINPTPSSLSMVGRPFCSNNNKTVTSTIKRASVFNMEFWQPEVDKIQPWELLKDCEDCQGEYEIPEIFAILYDPPGDKSYTKLVLDSSAEHVTTISKTVNDTKMRPAGFYTVKDEIHGSIGQTISNIGNFIFEGMLKGITITNTKETNTSTTYSTKLTEIKTFNSKQESEFAQHIGQDQGTIVAVQENKWKWMIGRRLKNGLQTTVPDTSDYDYRMFHRPLSSPSDLVLMSIPDLVAHYSDTSQQDTVNKQQEFLDALIEAIAIDTQTAKVKNSFVDSLIIEQKGGEINFSSTAFTDVVKEEQTEAFTYSLTISMEESKVKQLNAFGFTAGAYGYSQAYSNTHSTSNSSTVSREASYHLEDTEPWDKFHVQPYWDNRFGTWLFDVLENTYTSIPYEDKYSKKSVDWNILYKKTSLICMDSVLDSSCYLNSEMVLLDNDTLTYPNSTIYKVGDTVVYPFDFINTSLVNDELLNNLKVTSEIQNTLAGATTIFPAQLELARNDTLSKIFRITSDIIGIDTTTLVIHLLRPANSWDQEYVETKTITFITDFREVIKELSLNSDTFHFEVPSDQAMPIIHNFYATIINNGEQTESLDIGISTFSTGVSFILSTLEDSIKAEDTTKVTIGLTGQASYYPFTADFYAQISGESSTRKTITFVIDTLPAVGVESKTSPRLLLAGEVSWQSLFNPSTLKWRVGGNKDFKFNIYDCAGRMVSSIKTKNQLGLWNTSGKSSGIYFIKWTYENKSYSKKLVLFH